MSGIAAIIHFNGRPADQSHIEAMTARMAHRGPDGISHWVEGSVALGQCMFHTTEESLDAALPLADETGQIVLIMDGRVDNYKELRRLLIERGARLRSKSDAELVLQAYMMFEDECSRYFEGDYAAIIWDGRRKQAFCLRDAMGHRPFHYIQSDGSLYVSSEIAPFFDLPWFRGRTNESMLAQFIIGSFSSREDTLWAGIKRLPAAHTMTCDADGARLVKYWALDPFAPCPVTSEEDFPEYYRELLTDVIRTQSRSHMRLACEASGGLDLSAIFGLGVHLERTGQLLAPAIDGYTLKFEGVSEANDLPYARRLGAYLGKKISEVPPVSKPLAWYEEQARVRKDFPGFPNNGVVHLDLWAKAKENGSRVVLSGLGGDEWIDSSTNDLYSEAFGCLELAALRRIFFEEVSSFGGKKALSRVVRYWLWPNLPNALRQPIRAALYRFGNMEPNQESQLSADLRAALAQTPPDRQHDNFIPGRHAQVSIANRLLSPFRAFGMEVSERETAYAGVEMRMPFNDKRIVQLAHTVPPWWMRRGNVTKYAHRRALASVLPDDVLLRRDKAEVTYLYSAHKFALLERVRLPAYGCKDWLSAHHWQYLSALEADNSETDDELFRLWLLLGCCQLIHPLR